MLANLTARERLNQTKKYVKRLHEVQLQIMYECDDWKPPFVKTKSDKSDPTANRAVYNVDELESKLTSLRAEESELLERIGFTLRIIDGIRKGLGAKYADVIEWRYIDLLTWKYIKTLGVAKSTGYDLIAIACDWVDSIGITRIINCDYEI